MTKEMISGVVGSVITAVVLGVGAYFVGVFEQGSEAADKKLIREVIKEEFETDAGITYKARLAEVGTQITVLETRVDAVAADVEDLEDIAFVLAGGSN